MPFACTATPSVGIVHDLYELIGAAVAAADDPLSLHPLPPNLSRSPGERSKAAPVTAKHPMPPSGSLDLDHMRRAAECLIGTHDFGGFQAAYGRTTTVRTMYSCAIYATERGEVVPTSLLFNPAQLGLGATPLSANGISPRKCMIFQM